MSKAKSSSDRFSLECRFKIFMPKPTVNRPKSENGFAHCKQSLKMQKTVLICIILSLFVSLSSCKKQVEDVPQRTKNVGAANENLNSQWMENKDVKVSSSVEKAKQVLGIATDSGLRTPVSARRNRKLLDKIKKEFSEKILPLSQKVDDDYSKRRTTIDHPSEKPLVSSGKKGVLQKGMERDSDKSSSPNKLNQIEKDRQERKDTAHESEQQKAIYESKEGDLSRKETVASAKELPELLEEYVKKDVIKDSISHTSGVHVEHLNDKEDVYEEHHNDKGHDNENNEPVNEDTQFKKSPHTPSKATQDEQESVPPLGSKIEHDVVNAMKIRAHGLGNTSTDSSLVGNPSIFFTDNGDRTLPLFPDPRHFFTNISSKNFNWGSIGQDYSSPSRDVRSDGNTSASSSVVDFQKVIIFPQNQRFQSDERVKVQVETQLGKDTVEAAVVAEISDDVQKEHDESSHVEKAGDDPPEKEEDNSELLHQDTKIQGDESSIIDVLVPSNVVSPSEDEIEKKDTVEKEDIMDKKVKEKKDKRKEETIEGKDDSSEKILDRDITVTSEKSQTETVDEKDQAKLEDLKEQAKDKSQKKISEADTDDKSDEDDKKKDEGEKDDRDEIPDGKSTVELSEEGKAQNISETEEGKIEGEELDQVEQKPEDSDEQEEVKKSSKKKDKKKSDSEDDSVKAKDDGEVDKTSEEKSEDALETYSQFTQRVSAEKKNDAATTNGHGTNGHSKGSKVKGKNYASPDCGAKLVTANPEASHSSKVIHPNKDEYMLNKCRDKIWFIIELCESIRPQKFDIANFELFSNLPKDIQVFGSHRYPSRDWTSFGWFKGQEGNRGLQSFRIDTEDFFKYIKVEVTSHYGSEFFCPISSFQIYGLSEFEVIDTIEDPTEDTDDDPEPFVDPVEETTKKKNKEDGKQGVIPTVLKNMFSGVMDVIKRGYRPSSSASEPGENCYSLHPKFAVEKEICPMAGSLNYILSCYNMEYEALMLQPFVSSTVKNSSFCRQLAVTMCAELEVNDSIVYDTTCNNSYVCVMLSPKHVLAMCYMQDPSIMDKAISCQSSGTISENYSATSELLNQIDAPYVENGADINTSSITRTDALEANFSESLDNKNKKSSPEVIKDGDLLVEPTTDKKKDATNVPQSQSSNSDNIKSSPKESKSSKQVSKEKTIKEDHEANARVVVPDEKLEVEGSGIVTLDNGEEELPPSSPDESSFTAPSSIVPPAELKVSNSPTNKESVVVRLSNKIKALEYNMSISSQYLEELSRRYKRQMEEMQRQFNLTIAALNNTSTQAYERDQNHQRDIEKLEEHLVNVSLIMQKLVDERESLAHTVVEQHVLLMVIEVIVLCMVFTVCSRRTSNHSRHGAHGQTRNQTPSDDSGSMADHFANTDGQGRARVRRRSVDSITSDRNSRLRQRRPSEEALNISGTYQDLLIIEPAIPILMDSVNERKKKRKSSNGTLKRSKSNASIVDRSCTSRRAKRIEELNVSSAGVLFYGDEVDAKSSGPPPEEAQVLDSYSPNLYRCVDVPMSNEEASSVFVNYTDHSPHFHDSPNINDLGLVGDAVSSTRDCISKRHSVACVNCDIVQKKEKLSKSSSLGNAPDKLKNSQEKVKKVKKLKKAKIKDSVSIYSDASQVQSTFPVYSKDYYYPKPNGISYCSPIDTYNSYYYNGHNSVHFSDDTHEHCDPTYSSHSVESSLNAGYSNGIEVCGTDHYGYNEFSRHLDTPNISDQKKLSPKVKSKVKLRSDNWEWYSAQQPGSSGSETISTCSESSGQNRKVKKEEQVEKETKSEEKKGKRKKKSKSKSSSAALEQQTILEVEAGGT